jgi:hypothetical protein
MVLVLVPFAVVTRTSAEPAAWAGASTVRVVSFVTEKVGAFVPPKLMLVTAGDPDVPKPVPVIVTRLPPVVGPPVGLTPVTVGAVAP